MKRYVSGLVFLAAGIGGWLQPARAAVKDWTREWQAFRNAYPYHIQVVAISRPDGAGRRLMIISEPPPTITVDDIRSVEPATLAAIATARQRIGYDGWVKDVLIELPALDQLRLSALSDKLHTRLFGTSYKAAAVEIPASPPPPAAGYNFDLHVPASTLRKWLLPEEPPSRGWLWPSVFLVVGLWGFRSFTSARRKRHAVALVCSVLFFFVYYKDGKSVPRNADLVRFRPALGGDLRNCRELLTNRQSGVFLSADPGLVLWTVEPGAGLERYRREARQFALDSDIILGAVRVGKFVAIVGRERVAPIAVLPPLRSETILFLAAVEDHELLQSYERNHFFAGRFNAHDDWAPIYLSNALIDTEYGSLLNITDQLLKSWSQKGMVRYINFNYPDPPRFPFPEPLLTYAKTSEVTFNWNTKGSGYSLTSNDSDVFAWTRTGALPVDYLGGRNAKLHDAEDTGYEYFATRSDPNLVRVVQYAQLYQIFRHFHIAARTSYGGYQQTVPGVFVSEARKVIARFAKFDEAEIRARVRGSADDFVSCRQSFVAVEENMGGAGLDKLALAIAAPRKYVNALRESGGSLDSKDNPDAQIASIAFQCQSLGHALRSLADLTTDQLREVYAQSMQRETRGWIRTPSIVVSRPVGALSGTIGGHNLDSAITVFRASEKVAPGKVEVLVEDGKRVIVHNPEDAGKMQETVRTAARDESGSASQIQEKMQANLAAARADTRSMGETLNFSGLHQPDAARGFQTAAHASSASRDSGWWLGGKNITESQARLVAALHSDDVHAIVIERSSGGRYVIFDGPSRRIVEAKTQPAATDAVLAYLDPRRPKAAVRLHLRGFEPREAKGFTQSTELQLASLEEPPELTATVEMSETSPEHLRTLLAEKYNFKEVKIKNISEPFLTPEGERGVHVDAEIAAVKAAWPPLLVRITLILKNGMQMTAEMLGAIRTRILSAFTAGEIQVASDDTLIMTHAFVKSLEKINPDIGYVEVKVTKEGADLRIVLNRDNRSNERVTGRSA